MCQPMGIDIVPRWSTSVEPEVLKSGTINTVGTLNHSYNLLHCCSFIEDLRPPFFMWDVKHFGDYLSLTCIAM